MRNWVDRHPTAFVIAVTSFLTGVWLVMMLVFGGCSSYTKADWEKLAGKEAACLATAVPPAATALLSGVVSQAVARQLSGPSFEALVLPIASEYGLQIVQCAALAALTSLSGIKLGDSGSDRDAQALRGYYARVLEMK